MSRKNYVGLLCDSCTCFPKYNKCTNFVIATYIRLSMDVVCVTKYMGHAEKKIYGKTQAWFGTSYIIHTRFLRKSVLKTAACILFRSLYMYIWRQVHKSPKGNVKRKFEHVLHQQRYVRENMWERKWKRDFSTLGELFLITRVCVWVMHVMRKIFLYTHTYMHFVKTVWNRKY